jgi:hypothetical protein
MAVYKRNYQARKRAEQKAARTAIPPDIDEPHDITEDIPAIEVVQPAEKAKPSLKERFMGKVKQPTPDHKKRAKKVDSNLITQLAPTLVSTFLATYSRQWMQDPYKMCAPSQDEVLAMVAPYFNILSRYIEITGHASENVLDLINAFLASIMYGTRAYVTYVMIKEGTKTHESPNELVQRRRTEYRAGLEREAKEINAYNDPTEGNGPVGYPANQGINVENGHTNVEDDNQPDTRREVDRVADLLRRDAEGRRKLGLV